MHGPQVKTDFGTLHKSYLIAILDDHSRLITHAQSCLNETAEALKKCLLQAMQKRGVPQKFYVDNGAYYRAEGLATTCAWIGIALIHSRPYIPQGRGKIERFFRNVRESFLDQRSTAPQSLTSLNEQFSLWLEFYHNRVFWTLVGFQPADILFAKSNFKKINLNYFLSMKIQNRSILKLNAAPEAFVS
jgi:putative transposase